MIKIDKPIVGYSVVNQEKGDAKAETVSPPAAAPEAHPAEVENIEFINMDIDPTGDNRPTPDGFVDALRYKQPYVDTQGNRRSLYIMIGFERRKAMKGGEGFVIEHPVEVFAPAKEQIADTAAMVLASRCLRSGTPPSEVVNDFLSVALPENYYVRRPDGKQKIVHSMSAVVGEAMKQALIHRGLMDEYGEDIPYDQRPRLEDVPFQSTFNLAQSVGAAKVSVQAQAGFRPMGMSCPDCQSDEWVIKDGCPTCSCGYSKCG